MPGVNMNMEFTKHRLYVLIPLALACGFVAALFLYGLRLARQADEILAIALRFSNSQNQREDFAAIRKQYGKRLRTRDDCAEEHCSYEVAVDNGLLSKLHIAPFTELRQYFAVKRGRVQFTMLEYRSALTDTESPVVHVQTDFCDDQLCGWMYLHPWSTDSQSRYNGMVEVGYTATMQRRQEAYGLNVSCLYALGGCKDIAGLLPKVWKRTAEGNMSCLIPNSKGSTDWCKEALLAQSKNNCQ